MTTTTRARRAAEQRNADAYAALLDSTRQSARFLARRTGATPDDDVVLGAAHDAWARLTEATYVAHALATWAGIVPGVASLDVADAPASSMARASSTALRAAVRAADRAEGRAAVVLASERPRTDRVPSPRGVVADDMSAADACALAARLSRGTYDATDDIGTDHARAVVRSWAGAPTVVVRRVRERADLNVATDSAHDEPRDAWAPGAAWAPLPDIGGLTRKDSGPTVSGATLEVSHEPYIELARRARERAAVDALAAWYATPVGAWVASGAVVLDDAGDALHATHDAHDAPRVRDLPALLAYAPGRGHRDGRVSIDALHALAVACGYPLTRHAIGAGLTDAGQRVGRAVRRASV